MNLTGTVCRCLHPQKIVNPYTQEAMIVPCGKCEACALNRASRLSLMCDLEATSHKYCLFVTLTYANRYIPRAQLVESSTENFAYDLVEKNTGEMLGTVHMSIDQQEKLLDKFYLFGDVPYLRKTDLQKFFKRFRYYVGKSSKSKIRYFACGEYGPAHFRPHFHLLLYFSDQELLQICDKAILQSWPFGRTDVQLVTGSASTYVAGYVNSFSALPKIFKLSATCPFTVHSQKMGFRVLESPRTEVYASTVDSFIRKGVTVRGNYREFNMWRSYYAYYFPKCRGFANSNACERSYAYRVYDIARKAYPTAESTFSLAKEIAFDIFTFGQARKQYDEPTRKLFDYFADRDNIVTSLVSDYADRWIHRIYGDLLLSKHFLEFVCDHPTTYEINRKIKMIDDFYKRLDYLHLTDFFRTQSMLSKEFLMGESYMRYDGDTAYYPYMYDNVDWSRSEFEATPAYRIFDSNTMKMYEDKIKHKKANDLNKIFIYE